MKLEQFSNAERPFFVTFNEVGGHSAITITEEPEWVTDPLNADRQMLKVVGQDDTGAYLQLNARTQMPDAIRDAIVAADVEEIVVGGQLTVEFVEFRGKTKVYKAEYTPPSDPDKAPF